MVQELQAETAAEPDYGSQPIRQVQRDGVEYTIVGTAHVSRTSAEVVEEMAGSGDYDAIAVELCPARYAALTAERRWTPTAC